MKNLYKKYFFTLSLNPYFYLFSAAFSVFCALNFFLGQRFFSFYGSTDLHYFFASFPLACVLYIPLVASFIQDGISDDFLPFSDFKIVLAKNLAALTSIAFPLVLSAAVAVTVSFFGNLDYAQIFCAYFGIILYFAFSFSFTFFILNFIKSKVSGFVFSTLILAVFNTIHSLFLYLSFPPFIAEIFKAVSFAWHFDSFAKGILNFSDILFYLVLTLFFFFLTVFSREKRRGLKSKYFTHLKIASFLAAFLFLVIAANLNLRFDANPSKKFSVGEYSKSLIGELEQNLYIDYYVSPELRNLYPQVRDVDNYLENFSSKSDKIIYSVHNANRSSVKKQLELNNIPFQQLQNSSSDSSSFTNVYSAVSLNYLGKTQIIPFVLGTSSLEYDLDLKLLHLVRNVEHNVQILVGNSLSLDSDYSYVEPFFRTMGINVIRLSLPFSADTDIPLIVLGTENFSREDCRSFENFILDGGKAFAATSSYSIDLKNDWSVIEGNGWFTRQLFTFGLYFKNSLTADLSNFCLSLYSDKGTDGKQKTPVSENVNYSLWPVLQSQTNAVNGLTLFWPCAINLDNDVAKMENFYAEPYLVSSAYSWQVSGENGIYPTNPFSAPKYPESKSEFSSFNLAAAVYRENSGIPSLIVLGDQYAFCSGMINYSSSSSLDTRSLEFLTDAYFILSGEKNLVQVKNKTQFDYSLNKISLTDFSSRAIPALLWNILIPIIFYAVLFLARTIFRRRFNHEKI